MNKALFRGKGFKLNKNVFVVEVRINVATNSSLMSLYCDEKKNYASVYSRICII